MKITAMKLDIYLLNLLESCSLDHNKKLCILLGAKAIILTSFIYFPSMLWILRCHQNTDSGCLGTV